MTDQGADGLSTCVLHAPVIAGSRLTLEIRVPGWVLWFASRTNFDLENARTGKCADTMSRRVVFTES